MKKNILKLFAISCIFILSLTSCATSKVEEPDPYFLGDFDAFNLGEIVGLNKQNMFKPKTCNISVDFYPRTSSYSGYFKDGVNKVLMIFSPEECINLNASIDQYMALKESDGFDKNHKPGRKNHFNKGKIYVHWGTFGLGYEATGTYNTNYEYIDGNPYFRLSIYAAGTDETGGSISSNLYITPNQLEELKKITNKDIIMEEINKLNEAAYSFD